VIYKGSVKRLFGRNERPQTAEVCLSRPSAASLNLLLADAWWLDRKFPQFQQNEIFSLSDAFQRLDVDDKGYLDEATAIKATQQSENQPYDVVRQALKEVDLDSSRRVELEDYVGVRYIPSTWS
jgi:hypothetical protein